MTRAYRHGDVCLVGIKEVPEGVVLHPGTASKSNVLIQQGSGGNPHSFKGGEFYERKSGDFVLGYLVARDTKLYHAEHSPEGAEVEDGLYEVRFQVEHTHEGMKQVTD